MSCVWCLFFMQVMYCVWCLVSILLRFKAVFQRLLGFPHAVLCPSFLLVVDFPRVNFQQAHGGRPSVLPGLPRPADWSAFTCSALSFLHVHATPVSLFSSHPQVSLTSDFAVQCMAVFLVCVYVISRMFSEQGCPQTMFVCVYQ